MEESAESWPARSWNLVVVRICRSLKRGSISNKPWFRFSHFSYFIKVFFFFLLCLYLTSAVVFFRSCSIPLNIILLLRYCFIPKVTFYILNCLSFKMYLLPCLFNLVISFINLFLANLKLLLFVFSIEGCFPGEV